MGLSLICTTHYNKWDKYVVLFGQNTAAVNLRTVFKNEVVYFVQTMVIDIEAVALRANADLSGITDAKVLAKQVASDALGVITSNAFSFASANNLTALKAQMRNATSSKLNHEKDENFISRCNSINGVLTQVLADYPLTAINFFTALQLSDAMLLVTDFENKLGVWAVAEADVNNAKIEFEFEWMPKMAASLLFLERLLPGAIRTTYPAFASSFISLKKLVRVGVKDQGIHPTMQDSVTGDLFVNTGRMETLNYTGTLNQKVVITDDLGLFKLMKLRIGLWQIKFSAPGYVDQIITVRIERRKVMVFVVRLVKIV